MANVESSELARDLRQDFDVTLANYCDVFSQPSELIINSTEIVCVTGADAYMPFPVLEHSESEPRDITVICNTDALRETWEPLFSDVVGVNQQDARRIYLGMAFAWVGLVHSALDAREYRTQIDNMRSDVRTGDLDTESYRRETKEFAKRMKTVVQIQEALHDAETIQRTLEELECAGKIEASLYPYEIDEEEVQRVNRIRYGLGASYLMNATPQEARDELSLQFAQSLTDYTTQLGFGLVDFAVKFGLDKKMDPQEYRQKGLSRAFHSLYFAGIVPMDLSDIIRPAKAKRSGT